MVRFSNGTNHTGADRFLGAVTGIGLKIFGVEGKTLLEDEPDSHTFDYALINHPVFFINSVKHYEFLQGLFAHLGLPPPAGESRQEKRASTGPDDFLGRHLPVCRCRRTRFPASPHSDAARERRVRRGPAHQATLRQHRRLCRLAKVPMVCPRPRGATSRLRWARPVRR
jgi:hypothetical protein